MKIQPLPCRVRSHKNKFVWAGKSGKRLVSLSRRKVAGQQTTFISIVFTHLQGLNDRLNRIRIFCENDFLISGMFAVHVSELLQ